MRLMAMGTVPCLLWKWWTWWVVLRLEDTRAPSAAPSSSSSGSSGSSGRPAGAGGGRGPPPGPLPPGGISARPQPPHSPMAGREEAALQGPARPLRLRAPGGLGGEQETGARASVRSNEINWIPPGAPGSAERQRQGPGRLGPCREATGLRASRRVGAVPRAVRTPGERPGEGAWRRGEERRAGESLRKNRAGEAARRRAAGGGRRPRPAEPLPPDGGPGRGGSGRGEGAGEGGGKQIRVRGEWGEGGGEEGTG